MHKIRVYICINNKISVDNHSIYFIVIEVIKIIALETDLSILVPEKLARKYNLFPIELNEDSLVVGIEEENIYQEKRF